MQKKYKVIIPTYCDEQQTVSSSTVTEWYSYTTATARYDDQDRCMQTHCKRLHKIDLFFSDDVFSRFSSRVLCFSPANSPSCPKGMCHQSESTVSDLKPVDDIGFLGCIT